jgi:hypothetical protein
MLQGFSLPSPGGCDKIMGVNMVPVAQWWSASLWMRRPWVRPPSGTPKQKALRGLFCFHQIFLGSKLAIWWEYPQFTHLMINGSAHQATGWIMVKFH